MIERRRLRQVPTLSGAAPAPLTSPARTTRPGEYAARRIRRPQELLDVVAGLDLSPDETTRKQLLDWVQKVYEERGGGQLIGLFARCYLGDPYIDHRLSLDGGIAEHYCHSDAVPEAFVPCRGLARSMAYAYIEVYADGQVIPIRTDGNAAV